MARVGRRVLNRLSAREVATKKEPGKYPDGGNLYLVVDDKGRRRWALIFTWQGRTKEMGLGSVNDVSLEQARRKAAAARAELAEGRNPIELRRAEKAQARGPMAFGEAAAALIEAKTPGWRNAKHAAQWTATLTTYAEPLWDYPVNAIDTGKVLSVLQPIWASKAETASRVRGRIEAVLDYARAKGEIPANEANPARWRGHLDKLLAKPSKLSRGHHAALPFTDVPAFLSKLRERPAVAASALEFAILTAARTGEVLGATADEFDVAGGIWTVPARRMKSGRAHRVPLSARALAIFTELASARTGDFVFPGMRSGRPLSNMSMEMLLRRMGLSEVTVHGFRSSFRDWAGECSDHPREVIEAALAHVVGDMAERAYRRGDALEKRRRLMNEWARFCAGEDGGDAR